MKRWKVLIVCMIMLGINYHGISQDDTMKCGLRAGMNFSKMIVDDNIPAESTAKIGFYVGGIFSFDIGDQWRLNPELTFALQNSEYEFDGSINTTDPTDPDFGNTVTAEIEDIMLLVPVMVNYFVSDSFDIEVGPQLGYVVNRDVSDNSEDLDFGNDDYDRFELGINLGLGYNLDYNYRVGVRYSYGVTKRNDARSSVFQLGLSYSL